MEMMAAAVLAEEEEHPLWGDIQHRECLCNTHTHTHHT